MENKLVIHCIGLEGLTVTVFGADHSIPIYTDVLRVTTLLGSADYTIPQLPAIYDLADLNGNLTISDSSGKALYRWRLHTTAQPSVAEYQQPESQATYNLQRHRRPPSLSAPPSHCVAETPPITSSGSRLQHAENIRKVTHLESTLPRTSSKSSKDLSRSSPPVQKSKTQTQRKLKGRFNISSGGGPASLRLDTSPAKKQRDGTSGDGGLDPSESYNPSKRRSKRMDRNQNVSLQHLVDRLLRENPEDSEPFAKPVDAVAEGSPDYYTVIQRVMDLRTLKENLGKRVYSSVEDFEADFNLMIQNSISFNGPVHEISRGGLRLSSAFDALMASLVGRH